MTETFSSQVRMEVEINQQGRCYLYGKVRGCRKDKFLGFHHLIENTQANRKLYGERIQSRENAIMLCDFCHMCELALFKDKKEKLKDKWWLEVTDG